MSKIKAEAANKIKLTAKLTAGARYEIKILFVPINFARAKFINIKNTPTTGIR